ncbi:MAG: VWA domain-containing protein, partial [Myxococcota bacterium]|nr:VWA domain-containing protein [Myxococcota bacterium]
VRSLVSLGAKRRAVLAAEDLATLEPLVKWTDGAPLVARRSVGRGEAWIVTLPFSVAVSELPLRPAFLSLLDAWVRAAREHASPTRTDVGTTWTFASARNVEVDGPSGLLPVVRDQSGARVVPPVLGAYRLVIDGKTETRIAAPPLRELDFRPRAPSPAAGGAGVGERRAAFDASGHVAIVLLGLMALELVMRIRAQRPAS